jgi:prepilin-type N-terminal cleavage/methylation domain-containing protein
MKQGQNGFTLLEVVATTVMVGTFALLLAQFGADFFNASKANEQRRLAQAAVESRNVELALRYYFGRSRDFTWNQVGTSVPGYLVRRLGAVVTRADLRDCGAAAPNGFDPATSSRVANTTYVAFSCCGGNPQTRAVTSGILINNIPGVTPFTLGSACGIDWGLTVATFKLNPTTRKMVPQQNWCFRDIISMNVTNLGSDYFTQGASRYVMFDFLAQTSFQKDGTPSLINSLYFNFATSVGNPINTSNQPLNAIVNCSQRGEFY